MKMWMCERRFDVSVDHESVVVPVRFPVQAKNRKDAEKKANAISLEAVETIAPGRDARPDCDSVVLYPM